MPNSSFFSVIYKIPAGLSGKEDITFTASFDFSSGQCFLFQHIVIRDAVPTAVPLLKCTHDL